MSLLDVANALENHPDARDYHKLLALEVRARHDPALTDQYVADAVERFRNGDNETLAALAAWLSKIGRPAKTLEVLPQARALQRGDLFLQYLNALAALERWNDIKDLLASERSVIDPVPQHMSLAIAQAHLGAATAATNEWQRALEAANSADKLLALASYAEQNSVNDIADAPTPELSRSRQKTGKPTQDDCALRWQRGTRLKRKLSQRRLLSFGPMTQQHAIRMLICDCCSALRMAQRKQRNAKRRCL